MTLRFSLLTSVFLFGAACASSDTTPNEKAESSSAAIRAAEEVGATHSPDAQLHLQLAKEQFEHASKLTDSGDKDRADRLLLRAQADAELALALARSETEKAEALQAIDKVKKLKATATP
jgi:hypothetical protein